MSINSRLTNTNQQQLYQFRMISDNQKGAMVRHFMSQVKIQDMLNVAFMKPIQVALRTHRNDKSLANGSLPQGLMLADKKSINDNKYQLRRFLPVDTTLSYKELKQKYFMDNYISLLKKTQNSDDGTLAQTLSEVTRIKNSKTELGICVSMQNQDKKVLKKTLGGVADNVDQMIRSGVNPDDVFVVVVIDGILNVDASMYQFFEELQRESQIYLQEDEQLTLKKKYENSLYHAEVQKEQTLNFSKFLFKQEQFYERLEGKFINVRRQYDEILRIKKSVENIKNQNNADNNNLKRILNVMMDKQKQILKKINNGSDKSHVIISEESIMKELATSEEECNQYLSTREDLSYVSAYRLPTTSLSSMLREKQKNNFVNTDQSQTERMFQDQSLDKTTKQLSEDILNKNVTNKSKRYVNLLFCIKYKQSGKLSSHNWFFNGFCNQLKPKYSVLLDVGVRPEPTAIFKMYRYLKLNENVGSVCGYLRLIQEKVQDEQMNSSEDIDCISSIILNFVDIQRAQQLQYHFQNMIDKPFESLFKFMHVLPGSFSAYNMDALIPKKKDKSLLIQYFKSMSDRMTSNKIVPSKFSALEIISRIFFPRVFWKCFIKINQDSEEQILYNQTVNLSQERVLCLAIYKNGRDIIFMPDVFAKIEPIKTINGLMADRQKTINGGLFSVERVREQFGNAGSKQLSFFLSFQLLYLSFSNFLSTFAPALFLFACHMTTRLIQTEYLGSLLASQTRTSIGNVIYATFANIVDFLYALMILTIIFFSLHLKSDNKKFIYYIYLISTMMGFFTIIAFILYIVDIVNSFLGTSNHIRKQYQQALGGLFDSAQIGKILANILRYAILSSISVVVFPVVAYTIFYTKLGIVWEVIIGTFSFLFYSPTYLNILQIYQRCRLDDISSGKMSNLGPNSKKIQQSWKTIKMIEVSKFFIWNVIAAATLLILDQSIVVQYFALLFILSTFTFVQSVKIVFGFIYLVKYKCNMRNNPLELTAQQIQTHQTTVKSRIYDIVTRFQLDLKTQIQQSFCLASQESQFRKFQANMKKQQKQAKSPKKQGPNSSATQKIKPTEEQQARKIRQSIKLIQQFQQNRFKNLRESGVVKKDFYPQNVRIKKQVKPVIFNPQTPIQLLLLKQQLINPAVAIQDTRAEQQKLRQYEIFRGTMKPAIGM